MCNIFVAQKKCVKCESLLIRKSWKLSMRIIIDKNEERRTKNEYEWKKVILSKCLRFKVLYTVQLFSYGHTVLTVLSAREIEKDSE